MVRAPGAAPHPLRPPLPSHPEAAPYPPGNAPPLCLGLLTRTTLSSQSPRQREVQLDTSCLAVWPWEDATPLWAWRGLPIHKAGRVICLEQGCC
jgi:hypothetical protein